MTDNSHKILLSLCAGEKNWERWYEEAGYSVVSITLPEHDITKTLFTPDTIIFKKYGIYSKGDITVKIKRIHGILAAPPCTEFVSSGARWWKDKPPEKHQAALVVVAFCMHTIIVANPVFWALENPVGRLRNVLGPPAMYFNPCDYGDPYTKKTCLWGNFKKPRKNPVKPTDGSKLWRLSPSKDRAKLRAITPPGFAQAFFRANR